MQDNAVSNEQILSRLQKYHKKEALCIAPSVSTVAENGSRLLIYSGKPEKVRSSAAAGWIITILLAVVLSLALRIFIVEIVMVDGDSMQPTLLSDQRVVVDKISRYINFPERGEIVVAEYPDMPGYYVKRLIALPGDTVSIRNNTVFVNGSQVDESYLNADQSIADMPQKTVPINTIFLMGDNRLVSLDSRSPLVGPVSIKNLLGKALLVIWPLDQIHAL